MSDRKFHFSPSCRMFYISRLQFMYQYGCQKLETLVGVGINHLKNECMPKNVADDLFVYNSG